MRARFLFCILWSVLLCSVPGFTEEVKTEKDQTTKVDSAHFSWQKDWQNPPFDCRPLQIVHGADLTNPEQVRYYRDQCGLGGLVVNVGGKDYIRNVDNWKRFVQGVKNIKEAGLRVWIYDENGYPSLSAGGVVLEKDPSLESLELVWDKSGHPAFTVRQSYEFTHASNSYSEARRYPNPLNKKATETFLEVTHKRYRKELGEDLYQYVEAFFTDEPSMMAVNLGTIPEEHRVKVPTRDPLDPHKKMLPAVPWCNDMESLYKKKYNEELKPHFLSLFTGDSDQDRQIRLRFWQLVSELDSSHFYGTIRDFCRQNPTGPIASGHTLHEESLLHHVPLDGNKLKALKEIDLPGLDILSSNPENHFHGAWITAAFPCSAAELIGQRRVMTEVSDFSEKNYGRKQQVDLAAMEATAAWQAIWGITEFTLYYQIKGEKNSPYRNEATHKEYSFFVGRMNAILKQAKPVRPVLLYYPIEVIQQEYLPTAEKLTLESQSSRMKKTIQSFHSLGSALIQAQIPFILIDQQSLQDILNNESNKQNPTRTKAVCQDFSGIVYPWGVSTKNLNWPSSSFKEVSISSEKDLNNLETLLKQIESFAGPRLKMSPKEVKLAQGVFERDGRLIFVVSNPMEKAYQGDAEFLFPKTMSFSERIRFDGKNVHQEQWETIKRAPWTVFDPQTEKSEKVLPSIQTNNTVSLKITLPPRQTMIYVTQPVN